MYVYVLLVPLNVLLDVLLGSYSLEVLLCHTINITILGCLQHKMDIPILNVHNVHNVQMFQLLIVKWM